LLNFFNKKKNLKVDDVLEKEVSNFANVLKHPVFQQKQIEAIEVKKDQKKSMVQTPSLKKKLISKENPKRKQRNEKKRKKRK